MKKGYWVCVWLALLAALQELALRWVFPLPELKNFNKMSYMPKSLAVQNVSAVRSVDRISESTPDNASFTITLNYYGFRDENWKLDKPPRTARVMFVGDSFVEGDKVAAADAIPRLFQSFADAEPGTVQAMNFGVGAADKDDYVRLIADAAPWFKPDWVILIFFANDFSGGETGDPARGIERWPGSAPRLLEIIRMLQNREMLPFRWSFRKIRTNQPVPHPNNPFSDPEHEKGLRGFVSPRIIAAMKAGGFNPFRPGSSWWYEEMLGKPLDISADLIGIGRTLNESRTRLLVAYIPERRQISNYYKNFEREFSPDDFDLTQPAYQVHQRQLAEQCAALGIPFLDLSPALAEEEGRGNHLYWNYDDHLRARGNHVVAKALFAAWKGLSAP